MIGRLRGIVVEKQPPEILLDVNGVFYEVLVPMTSIYLLPELQQEVTLHTHFVVQETAQQLYGFYEKQDRDLFRTLIKVNGVGPKMGLGILSGMEVADIVRCVKEDNSGALVKVPGVGKKTAERLVIELRDKLKDWDVTSTTKTTGSIDTVVAVTPVANSDILADAESALIALGYKPAQAAQVIMATQKEHQVEKSEDLIRLALRSLAAF